ncbi:hypothetical protein FRB90_005928, partial [Tulasnella sp. 427]
MAGNASQVLLLPSDLGFRVTSVNASKSDKSNPTPDRPKRLRPIKQWSAEALNQAVNTLQMNIEKMNTRSPRRFLLPPLPPASGQTQNSWPEFARRGKSRVMKRAQRESDYHLEDDPESDTRPITPAHSHNRSFRSQDIAHAVEENEVVFVYGDASSGLLAEVPQAILDHQTYLGRGAECQIVVVSSQADAVATAEITAGQRAQRLGHQVGYE